MRRHAFIDRAVPYLDALVPLASPTDCRQPPGLLVALSGGPDSVALALTAAAWATDTGAPLEAAHLNHCLRRPAADDDEAFCRDLCARLGIPLHTRQLDPRPLARRRGRGLEEAARHLRRRLLGDLLAQRPHLGCAATGHHRDDQAETIVMRLLRGSGLDGLRGIRPVSGRIVHPLLAFTRREIVAFLSDVGQPFRTDETNETGTATRTRVRRELLPLARDIFGQSAVTGPARLPEAIEPDVACLDALAAEAAARLTAADGSLDADGLLELPTALARRVLRQHLVGQAGLHRDVALVHVVAALSWLAGSRSGTSIDLPGGWRLAREFARVRVLPPATAAHRLPTGVSWRILVERDSEGGAERPAPWSGAAAGSEWRLEMPASALHGEPRLRRWRAGDRMQPLGLAGHKKVSDLLRERRVPLSRRADALVCEDDAGILWVIGVAQEERTRWLPVATETVTLRVIPSDDPTLEPGSAQQWPRATGNRLPSAPGNGSDQGSSDHGHRVGNVRKGPTAQ